VSRPQLANWDIWTRLATGRSDRATGVSERGLAAIDPAAGDCVTIRIPVGQPLIWNEAALALLGTMSDAKLAKVLGVTSHTVGRKRHSLNIEPFRQPSRNLTIVCVIDGKKTKVSGRRASRLRQTCLPPHWVTRPRSMSACQRELIRQTLLARQGTSASLKKILSAPGMGFIGFDTS
jgi:hypothetical protein